MEQGADPVPVTVEGHGALVQEHAIFLILLGGVILFAASVVRAVAAPDTAEGALVRGLSPLAPLTFPRGFSRGDPST